MNRTLNTKQKLQQLLKTDEKTEGMYVRKHGDHFIVGRQQQAWPPEKEEKEKVDKVRLTNFKGNQYGLSVKRHNGRWEKTPFSGSLKEMVEILQGPMQHLIADWP